MILFPAIDLIGGKVVRLERGDRSRCKVYSCLLYTSRCV